MYEFHYDYMKPKFNKDLQLCYMDTDSLIYHIKKEDFYADIVNDVEEIFDTSGYVPDGYYVPGTAGQSHRPLPIGKNKKVIRLMKDEFGGTIMTKFVLPRPKLYSYKKLDGSETPNGPHFVEDKKCKGIKKCVVKKTLTFEDYKDCLFEDSAEHGGLQVTTDPHGVYGSQLMFRSIRHELFTLEVNKVALNKNDDKHIAKKDGISTLARGHKNLSWSPNHQRTISY